MTKDPGFTLRGRFEGRNVVLRWRGGELVEAPDDIRSEVARMIAEGRWVRRELAHPWHYDGVATMEDRWLAQAVLLTLLEDEPIELNDPVLDAEVASWHDDAVF